MILTDGKNEVNLAQTIVIMGSGLPVPLPIPGSDTFWYSAVEGEVYAYSSMFTALVFWLILKWEEHADEPHSDRWIIPIFYLTGLSIGVHLPEPPLLARHCPRLLLQAQSAGQPQKVHSWLWPSPCCSLPLCSTV